MKPNSFPWTNPLCSSTEGWTFNSVTQSCSQLCSVPFEPWAVLCTICDLLSPSVLPTVTEAAPCSFSAFLWNQLSALLLLPHQAPSQTPPVSRFSSFPREGVSLPQGSSFTQVLEENKFWTNTKTTQWAASKEWSVTRPSHWTLILKLKGFKTRKCSPDCKLFRFWTENKDKLDGVSQRTLKE